MIPALFTESPHRRWNALLGEWVIVSPNRTQRPWQGQTEDKAAPAALQFDPACYLCPGNLRAGGVQTPVYTETFVFENDFAALKVDVPSDELDIGNAGLLRATTEKGICRVLCFTPRHDLTLATMGQPAIRTVVEAWIAQETELAARPEIGYVQIFENRGAMMGASNPHPHGQIWATEHLPDEPARELDTQLMFHAETGKALLSEYLRLELEQGDRIIAQNETWVALVPFWAVWPYEVMLLPRQFASTLRALSAEARDGLADILGRVTAGYNRVFETPFPYSMGFHGAPCDEAEHPEWLVHAHFYPPLLRSATVRKFMVGFELLGSPQRDITPESAAMTLRGLIEQTAGEK